MNEVRAVLLSLLTVGGMIAGVTLAAGVAVPDGSNIPAEQVQAMSQEETSEAEASDEANSTFGSKISAFMQSNAAQTDGAVETGMWIVAFENASNQSVRSQLVERQTNRIRQRLEDVEAEKQRLIEQREAGEISRTKYESRMSTVIGSYLSLTAAIDTTEPRAKQAGADGTEIAELRRSSRNFTGPEVAEVARNIGGARPPGLANETGGPGNAGLGAENGNGEARRSDVPGNASEVAGGNATETTVDRPAETADVIVGNGANASGDPSNRSANGDERGAPTTVPNSSAAVNDSTAVNDTAEIEYTEDATEESADSTETVTNTSTTTA